MVRSYDDSFNFLSNLFNHDDYYEIRGIYGERRRGGIGQSFRKGVTKKELVETWIKGLDSNPDIQGVFVCVNPVIYPVSGKNGTATDKDVSAYRCIYVDIDSGENLDPMSWGKKSLPHPSMVVQSGNGIHFYWCFEEELSQALWRGLQEKLIEIFGGDPACKNPSRVMRIPGTDNKKYNPYKGCRLEDEGPTYDSWTDLEIDPKDQIDYSSRAPDDRNPEWINLNATAQDFLAGRIEEGDRNNHLNRAAMDMNGNNFPIDVARNTLVPIAMNSGLSEQEALDAINSAYSQPRAPSHSPMVPIEKMMSLNDDECEADEEAVVHNTDEGKFSNVSIFSADFNALPPPAPTPLESENVSLDEDGKIRTEFDDDSYENHLPIVQSPRPRFEFYGHFRRSEDDPETGITKKKDIYTAKPISQLGRELRKICHGWPRWSDCSGLFSLIEEGGSSKQWTVHRMKDKSDLGTFLHAHTEFSHRPGNNAVWSQDGVRRVDIVSKEEFFKHLTNPGATRRYRSIQAFPTEPRNNDRFYLPFDLPEPTGERLAEFLEALNPETELDRLLMKAATVTPGWGGPPGKRPAFVFASDHGQGSGKTETARAIASIWGGARALTWKSNWEEVMKALASSSGFNSRVFLFDNVKKKMSSESLESALTDEWLSGWRTYTGTVSRPNDATYFITANIPRLSRDMAQRAVEIKIGEPHHENDFIGWYHNFIEAHRPQLISDCLEVLRSKSQPMTRHDRWKTWSNGVLSRVCEDPDELQKLIASRRESMDDDQALVSEIQQTLDDYFHGDGKTYPRDHAHEEGYTSTSVLELLKVLTDEDRGPVVVPKKLREEPSWFATWLRERMVSLGLVVDGKRTVEGKVRRVKRGGTPRSTELLWKIGSDPNIVDNYEPDDSDGAPDGFGPALPF